MTESPALSQTLNQAPPWEARECTVPYVKTEEGREEKKEREKSAHNSCSVEWKAYVCASRAKKCHPVRPWCSYFHRTNQPRYASHPINTGTGCRGLICDAEFLKLWGCAGVWDIPACLSPRPSSSVNGLWKKNFKVECASCGVIFKCNVMYAEVI